MQENERYMESLQAKEQALKAEFEDFSNRVLSKEFVGGLLDAGKALLDFANNDVGAAATRIAALSTSVVGIVGIAGTAIGKLSQLSKALSATGGATGFLGTLLAPKTLLIIGGVAAAIGLVVEAVRAYEDYAESQKYENLVKHFEETQQQAEEAKDKVQELIDKLNELNKVPMVERGQQWNDEKQELENLLEYYRQLERYREKEAKEAQQRAYTSDVVSGVRVENISDYSLIGEYSDTNAAVLDLADKYNVTLSQMDIDKLSKMSDDTERAAAYVNMLRENLEYLGLSFEENTQTADEYMTTQAGVMNLLARQIRTSKELTQAQKDEYAQYLEANQGRYEYLLTLDNLNDAQEGFVNNFNAMIVAFVNASDDLQEPSERVVYLANTFGITAEEALKLARQLGLIAPSTTVALSGIEQLTDGTWRLKDSEDAAAGSGEDLATANDAVSQKAAEVAAKMIAERDAVDTTTRSFQDLVAQEILFGNNGLDITAKLASLKAYAKAIGATVQQLAALDGVSTVGATAAEQSNIISSESMGSAGWRVSRNAKKMEEKANAVADVAANTALDIFDQIADEVAANKTKPKGSGGGSSIKKSIDETADYAEQKAKQAAEKAAQEAEQAAKEAAEKVKEQINESFDALKEAEEAYWDDKIDALETQNKLLDRQTQLEEKLKALQEAKEKKILLYKDGRFQYGEDIGAISKAQEDYNETWRDIYVEEQKEILNDLKDKALALIEEYRDKALENGQLTRDDISALLSEYQELGNNTYQTVAYGMENITNLVASGMSALNGSVGNVTSSVTSNITGTMGSVGSAMKSMVGSMSTAAGLLNQQFGQGLSAIQSTLSNALGMSSGNYAGTIADFRREHWGETTGQFNKLSMLYGGDVAWWIGMMGKYLEDPEKNANLQIGTNADGSPMTLKQLYETDWAKQAFNMGSMGGIDDYIAREQAKYILNGGSKYDYDNLNKIAQDAYRELYFRNPSAIAPGAEWYSGSDAAFAAAQYGIDAALRYSGSDFNVWEGLLGKYYFGNRDVYGRYRQSQYDIYKQMASQGGTSATARATAEWAQNKINEIDQQIYGETLNEIDRQLAENSRKWYEADEEEKKRLHLLNEELRKNRGEYKKKVDGNANGTLSWRGGLSVVGEKGPELRVLNRGDGIIPADVTANLWKMGANPTKYMNDVVKSTSNMFNISSLSLPNARDADSLVKGLKELAHQYVTKRS